MNTSLSTKVAALMLALAVNSVIMGSVALMFNAGAHRPAVNVAGRVTLLDDRSAA